jgi:hypothetical protein
MPYPLDRLPEEIVKGLKARISAQHRVGLLGLIARYQENRQKP